MNFSRMQFLLFATVSVATVATGEQPNILWLTSEDNGPQLGCYGDEYARTPNIDALVEDGVILDRHYVYKFCSPTRSSFLSGRLPYHVNEANR